VASPPPRAFSPAIKSPLSPPVHHTNGSADPDGRFHQLQQTIAGLTAEKTSLAATAERLQSFETSEYSICPKEGHSIDAVTTGYLEVQALLQSERQRTAELQQSISSLTQQRDDLSQSLERLKAMESSENQVFNIMLLLNNDS
jgi:chromosome segregation ATPase